MCRQGYTAKFFVTGYDRIKRVVRAVQKHAYERSVGIFEAQRFYQRRVRAGSNNLSSRLGEFAEMTYVIIRKPIYNLSCLLNAENGGISRAAAALAVVVWAIVLIQGKIPVAVIIQAVIKSSRDIVSIGFCKFQIPIRLNTRAENGTAALACDKQFIGVFVIESPELSKVVARIPVICNTVAVFAVFSAYKCIGTADYTLAAVVIAEYFNTASRKLPPKITEKIGFFLFCIKAGFPNLMMTGFVLDCYSPDIYSVFTAGFYVFSEIFCPKRIIFLD
jgi:hypothetical protein